MDKDRRRAHVYALTKNPFTREEIEAAQAALRSYLADYPEEWVRDIGHGLTYDHDYMLEREDQSQAMGLTEQEHRERERLVGAAYEADAPGDLVLARGALQDWQHRHPDDPLVPRLLELLDSTEEVERELQASRSEAEPLQRAAA
jgi:hypothetical protein